MLWFNFILGLNFIFLCFKLIIIHSHILKQREIKFKPRTKLNHNIYVRCNHCYSQVLIHMCHVAMPSCSALKTQLAWGRPDCRLSQGSSQMASFVLAHVDQCLAMGMTY